MFRDNSVWRTQGATSLFVLLWSSGAIFARLGLDHASAFAFLVLRFAIAFGVLSILALARRRAWWPAPGTRARIAAAGALLLGAYSICYFLALDHGVAPGVLASVLGAQPLVTLVITERRFSAVRAAGLGLALCGLVLVVYQSVVVAQLSVLGIGFALGALAGATAGAILQKQVTQPPEVVLPLQYGVALALCLVCAAFQPLRFEPTLEAAIALLWLALVISVAAQLLLYRLIRAGNLVNVTSLLYLVPITTAILDRLVLGNPVSPVNLAGMAAILAGLAMAFRRRR